MHNEEFQRRVLDFQDRAGADLAALKTQMASLVGETGRVEKMETDVKQLQASQNQGKGARHILELALGFIGGALSGWLSSRHG